MPPTPRWEFRVFGHHFGPAEAPLAALVAEKVQESDEHYLLSPTTDANLKVRDDLVDLKAFVTSDAAGLEQWRPVMKAAFPLGPADLRTACDALGVPAPADAISLDALRAALAPRGIRTVAVHKRRVRHTIGGCMAEVTEVIADGHPVRTVAIESEDPAAVVAAVRSMHLDALPNTSYPRGLKSLLGVRPAEA
jgi:exopolyphosphatase/guanosine-5'-triphosphate,3'-diphosphate pyrophosphatase